MSCRFKPLDLREVLSLSIAFLAIAVGILYYGLFRQPEPSMLSSWVSSPSFKDSLFLLGSNYGPSIPSFLHAFASMLLLHSAMCRFANSGLLPRLLMLASLLVFELGMGYFDANDVLAVLLGIIVAESVWFALSLLSIRQSGSSHHFAQQLTLAGVLSISGLLAAGSYIGDRSYSQCAYYNEEGYCEEYKRAASPVYMSYQTLRSAIEIQVARPPDRLGRLYVYGDYIFLNEVNQGIHVIDNHNPAAPVNKGFIRIPGNMDIAIRGNYLYADSYIDLITLDLTEPDNIREVNRQQGLFPYNEYQNIPYNVSLLGRQLDQQRGVVVGYTLTEE